MPITFIHAADIHLGMENYGKIDPGTGLSERLLDYLGAMENLVETAIAQKVDFVVLTGDIYKNPNPSSTVRRELIRILKKLHDYKLPLIIITGNHDQANSYGKAHALSVFSVLELPNLQVVDTPRLITLNTKNGELQLICIPWPQRSEYFGSAEYHSFASDGFLAELTSRVDSKVEELAAQAKPDLPLMFFGHLMVKGATFSGTEGMLSLGKDPQFDSTLFHNKRFAYVGLGHIHHFQDLNTGRFPPIVYSGSLNRIDFQEKDDAKGFILGKLQDGKASYRFREVKDRPFLEINVSISESDDPTSDFIEQLDEYYLEEAIVKISYQVDDDLKPLLNWRKIHNCLEKCHYVVSIIPVKSQVSRAPRLNINETFTVEKAFAEYLKVNPALENDTKKLTSLLTRLIKEAEIK